MKNKHFIFILLAVAAFACQEKTTNKEDNISNKPFREISFLTTDSLQVIGDLYETDKQASSILLFHQGRSNARGEYKSIIPKLTQKGFNVLAIDQRMGGQLYGEYNRTIAKLPMNNHTYCDAFADMEAAFQFMSKQGFSGKKILWGSSYSGSLAIKLAHNHPTEVIGVLAFSPSSGGPMQDCRPDEFLEKMELPILLLRPKSELEIPSAKAQFELATAHKHQTYVADQGTHGSSMLVEERVNGNVTKNWERVFSFLDQLNK